MQLRSQVVRGAMTLALMVATARSGVAASIEGVYFADRYDGAGTPLLLNGVRLRRYMLCIKGYVAALYLGNGGSADGALGDVPKRLAIEYFHRIPAADIARVSDQIVADNVDPAVLPRLRPALDQLNALYEDVKPGDRYSLTYVPGKGTELDLNGQPKGTIEGAEVAAAVFSIWVGPKPIDVSLKWQWLSWS